MELQYLILALGFTGKYERIERGHEQLADLQQNVVPEVSQPRAATCPRTCLCGGAAWRTGGAGWFAMFPWWVVVAAGAGRPRWHIRRLLH